MYVYVTDNIVSLNESRLTPAG